MTKIRIWLLSLSIVYCIFFFLDIDID
jgi:hypothetical protein